MSVTTKEAKDSKRELPDGWRWVRLGEVCETTSGGTPPRGNKNFYGGGIPWIKSGELRDCSIFSTEEKITEEGLRSSAAKILPSGTLLIAMYGATVGRLGICEMSAATNQAVCALKPKPDAYRDFLFFYLLMTRNDLIETSFGGAQPNISQGLIRELRIPFPPFSEQKRIAGVLRKQMATVEKARSAAQTRLEAAMALPASFVSESLTTGSKRQYFLDDCLIEIRNGIGADWSKYPLLGATRDGLAPAKEGVGKAPERYKLVDPVTVFYNPMRILLGSIAMVSEVDMPGITSPDYVVVKGRPGALDTRWFYHWFRSVHGVNLIASLSRGAVRERILFNRLATGVIDLPDYQTQQHASDRMKHVQPVVEAVTKELQAINTLPAALLRRAFSGEL